MKNQATDTPGRLIEQLMRSARLLHRSRHQGGKFETVGDGVRQGERHACVQSSRSQIRLLNLLAEVGTIPLKQIVEKFDIRPSSASELVSKLEARGFVTREANSEDKRVSNVSITDEGRSFAKAADTGRKERFASLFSGLTEGEQEQLVTLLEKLNGSLKEQVRPAERHGHGPGRGFDPDSECGRAHGPGHGPGFRHHHGFGHGSCPGFKSRT